MPARKVLRMKTANSPKPEGSNGFQRVTPLWVWGKNTLKINLPVFSCKHYILLGVVFVFFACSEKNKYQAELEGRWAEVENFIHANWRTSLVDSKDFPQLKKKGIILPYPFMSIARGEPALFYWDNYFTNKGLLLIDSLSIYARNVVDNLLWEVDTLGFAPNASMNWGMNRSQIPFLAPMVFDVYEKYRDKDWLRKSYFTLKKRIPFLDRYKPYRY